MSKAGSLKLAVLSLGILFAFITPFDSNAQFNSGIQSVEFLEPTFGDRARISEGMNLTVGLNIECNGSDFVTIQIPTLNISETKYVGCTSNSGTVTTFERFELAIPDGVKPGVYDIEALWKFIHFERCTFCVAIDDTIFTLGFGTFEPTLKAGERMTLPLMITGPGDLSQLALEFKVEGVDVFFPGVAITSITPNEHLSSIEMGVTELAALTSLRDSANAFKEKSRQQTFVLELELEARWAGKIKITAMAQGSNRDGQHVAIVRDDDSRVFAHQVGMAEAVIVVE